MDAPFLSIFAMAAKKNFLEHTLLSVGSYP